jgi:hypothetical protein
MEELGKGLMVTMNDGTEKLLERPKSTLISETGGWERTESTEIGASAGRRV